MSNDIEDILEDEQIGQTSSELDQFTEEGDEDITDDSKPSRWAMTVYDVMLLISLVSVVLATLLLFFELRNFGDYPFSLPWYTDEAMIK